MIVLPQKDRTDGVYFKLLEMIKSDVPILLLSRIEDLSLNEDVLNLAGQKYVIVDVIENSWQWDQKETLIVGENTMSFFSGEGWQRLHDFVNKNPAALYLKRELLAKDVCKDLLPIEYPNWQPDYSLQLKHEFDNRPISAFNYWGRSHEARLMLQGQIWIHAAKHGYSVCDNIYQYMDFMHHEKGSKKIVSFHMPFYGRVDISELMKINIASKISISLFGCGVKCFRSTGESIVNSVCLLPEDKLAYSYPLEHGENCIRFSINNDVTGLKNEWHVCEAMEQALRRKDLYDIYIQGKKAADWYRIDNYSKYLENLINHA